MNWLNVKYYLPRYLFVRASMIYLVPVLTILGVMAIVFIQRLYEDVTRQMTTSVADEVMLVLNRVESAPDRVTAISSASEVAVPLGIGLEFTDQSAVTRRGSIDLSGATVIETLHERLPNIEGVDLVTRDGRVLFSVPSRHGVLTFDMPRLRFSARNPHQFLVLIGFTALIMTLIAMLYLRGQVRPIRRLAAAATAFGKGRRLPYNPSGAAEVREAGHAFLEMRDRIESQIEQRTAMLSGVSHDLRTPLTRMRLELGLTEDRELADQLSGDITEMENMVNAFLEFARNESPEEMVATDISDLIATIVDNFKRQKFDVQFSTQGEKIEHAIQPLAMQRAITNLLSNAQRYADRALVSIILADEAVSIRIEDDGPGISPEDREEALAPFKRLDESRNQDAGSGVGLGLAIANGIARQHGGQLVLGESPSLGGLSVAIRLPR